MVFSHAVFRSKYLRILFGKCQVERHHFSPRPFGLIKGGVSFGWLFFILNDYLLHVFLCGEMCPPKMVLHHVK